MAVPNYIRRFREAHGLTGEDLAGRVNVSPSTLSKWETHSNEVSDSSKLALAEFFNVPVGAIFHYEYNATADALRRTLDVIVSLRGRIEKLEEARASEVVA